MWKIWQSNFRKKYRLVREEGRMSTFGQRQWKEAQISFTLLKVWEFVSELMTDFWRQETFHGASISLQRQRQRHQVWLQAIFPVGANMRVQLIWRKEIGWEILEINVLHQGHLESEVTGKRRPEETREDYGLHHGNCCTSISENSSYSVLQCVISEKMKYKAHPCCTILVPSAILTCGEWAASILLERLGTVI